MYYIMFSSFTDSLLQIYSPNTLIFRRYAHTTDLLTPMKPSPTLRCSQSRRVGARPTVI